MKLVETDVRPRETDTESEPGTSEDGLGGLAEQRGISVRVLSAAGIQTDRGGGRHDGWWRIPYPHRTGIHKYRYRNPDTRAGQRYHDSQGADFHLYNPELLGPGEPEVWFCEGEFDTLAMIDQGYKAIGIHGVGNKPVEDEQKEGKFRKSWQLLFAGTMCFTIFDNDPEGLQAGRRLARFLDGEAFDGWQNGYGDVNEWHKSDPEGLADALSRYRDGIYRGKGMEPWG